MKNQMKKTEAVKLQAGDKIFVSRNSVEAIEAKTADEARQSAMDWQEWQSKQNLSYGELAEWQGVFTTLAERFGLTEEFKENGII